MSKKIEYIFLKEDFDVTPWDKKGKIAINANEDGWCLLSPNEAIDLATKIINHCYPFTIPKRNQKL